MDILSFLPTWVTNLSATFNFVILTLVVLYILAALKEHLNDVESHPALEMGIICGDELHCRKLAALLRRAERFELSQNPEQVLRHAMRRNMILLFIVKNEISGIAKSVFTHLQSAHEHDLATGRADRYANLRYAVFGVGDTNNDDYNALAAELDLRLRKIGARNVQPMRLYDEVTSPLGLYQEFADFVRRFASNNIGQLTNLPESSEYEESDANESNCEQDTDNEDNEQIQEIEIVEPETEVEKPVIEAEKPVKETVTPVSEAVKPAVETVEPVVEAVCPVVESVKPEVETVKPEIEVTTEETEEAVRQNVTQPENTESDDDEEWEIIKCMSSEDDSS